MSEKCKDCLFWFQDPMNEKEGECRFNPPQSFLMILPEPMTNRPVQTLICLFPRIKDDLWCGRYRAKLAV